MKSLDICGENFVNDLCTITVSSGDAYKAKLYDQKPSTQWVSVGSAEDGAETVLIEFIDRAGNPVSRTFNRLIFLNTNLAKGYVEYWDGADWQSISESVYSATPNDSATIYVEMAVSVSATKVRITITNTIAAAAEKTIGEFKVCLLKSAIRCLVSVDREDYSDGDSYRLQGGGLVSYQNVRKFEAEVGMVDLDETTYATFRSLLQDRSFMTWVLWSDFILSDIYEVAALDRVSERLDKKTQLWELSFNVGEK